MHVNWHIHVKAISNTVNSVHNYTQWTLMSVYKYYVPNAIEIDHFSVNTYPLRSLGKFNDIDIFQTNLYIKNLNILTQYPFSYNLVKRLKYYFLLDVYMKYAFVDTCRQIS